MREKVVAQIIKQVCQKAADKGFESLTDEEKTIHLIANLDSETAINGLIGYYNNSSGDYALETINALNEIGCLESAKLLKESYELFPNQKASQNRDERLKQMELLSSKDGETIQKIGHSLLEYPDNLGLVLNTFILKHQKFFDS